MAKEDAQKAAQRDLRDRLRTNRSKDGSLSAAEVDAILTDLDRELGEDREARPPQDLSDEQRQEQDREQDRERLRQADRPSVARGNEDTGSARPGAGSTDFTPGRDALPGTPPDADRHGDVPTGGPVGDNNPPPGVGGAPSHVSQPPTQPPVEPAPGGTTPVAPAPRSRR